MKDKFQGIIPYANLNGPYDGVDPEGNLWIPPGVRERKRAALGLDRPSRPAQKNSVAADG